MPIRLYFCIALLFILTTAVAQPPRPNNLWQVKDKQQATLFSITCDTLYALGPDWYAFGKDQRFGTVPKPASGQATIMYDSMGVFPHALAIVKNHQLYGLIDKQGKYVLEPQYKAIRSTAAGLIKACRNHTWFLFDAKGRQLTAQPYDSIGTYTNGFFQVYAQGRQGLINRAGKPISQLFAGKVLPFVGQRAIMSIEGKQGVIDTNGQWLIKPNYKSITILSDSTFLISKGSQLAIIDAHEHEIAQGRFVLRADGYIAEHKNKLVGLLAPDGCPIAQPIYDSISLCQHDSLFIVANKRKHGILHVSGQLRVPPDTLFEYIGPWTDKLAIAKVRNRYGFIDKEGFIRIAARYQAVSAFKDGLAAVRLLDQWGVIDFKEQLRLQPFYDYVWPQPKGIIIIKKQGKFGIASADGAELVKPYADTIVRLNLGNFMPVLNQKRGLITADGKQILYCRYTFIDELPNGHFRVSRNGLWGISDAEGIPVIPLIYPFAAYNNFDNNYILRE